MGAARYARIQEVFLAVCVLPRSEQDAALGRECAGDAALEEEVRSLLVHHRDESIFSSSQTEPASQTAPVDTGESAPAKKDGDPVSTLPGSRAFPVPGWDRYEPGDFLGEGGMGRVYKARDPRLRRHVALKFIRSDDPKLVRRFFREARLQASIDHPHICKVYEVGEIQGMPYIAMAHIDGVSLKQAHRAMTLEQKVGVMVQVCMALQAAHRTGLIHRDIKPANIMVEQLLEESFHPYVVDFGVARDISGAGETTTGAIEGTPCYMAPEQASGGKLDRRTDVYSLGATLYELLCDQPPFHGQSGMEVFLSLAIRDPISPRKLSPDTPEALQTITLKCLEKDPGRRYDSAKALADDLQRYLDAEPIHARPPGLAAIALKKARRNKALVGVTAAALALVLAAAGAGLSAMWSAARQAELAQRLGQDVKEIELLMRYAYGLPVHDASREKARVREKMARIEAEMAQMGTLAVGPSRYALGRGHLVLHEPAKALVHLRTAWEADYRKPEVEYALGQALGELYKEGLEQAQRISDKDARQARERALEEELLKPALEHLRRVGNGEHVESPAYVEGLIAFYSKQYDEALRKASDAAEQSLWRHEASKLQGDVHTALGNEKRDQGQHEAALEQYTRAAAAYRKAREAARSDATIHDAECQMWVQVIELQAARGTNPKPSLDEAVSACDEALLADPNSASAYGHKSWAYARWGTHLAKTMQPPRQAFETSIELGKHALSLRPEDPSTLDTLGTSHMAIANHQLQHGEDPRDALRQAATSFEQALKIHPTFAWAWNDLGLAFCAIGDYEAGHGIDPRPSYDRCIDSVRRSFAQDPSYYVPLTNEALANAMKALYELRSGIDPRAAAEQAEACCQRSLAINPSYQQTHEMLGISHLVRAEHDLYRDLDPAPSAKKAVEAFSASLSIYPSAFYSHMGIALAHRLQAMHLLRKGTDPNEALQQANAEQAKMAEINPDEAETHLRKAQIAVLSARWAARGPGDQASERFEEGEQAIDRAIQSNSMNFEIFETAADLYRFKAIWQMQRKKSPRGEIEKGLAAADRGLEIHPNASSLIEVKGALQLLQARAEGDSEAKSELARQAQALLDEAFRKNPFLKWIHAAMWAELPTSDPQPRRTGR